ncbi:MAG: Mur ligase domain-containing protein, partial [Anaerolineales bacterium]|nr:Mur ligase domain-containing protein [Anaerolineales bacterium]
MLTLADVIEALTNTRPPQAETVITEAAIDSRQVIPGSLFVALPGERVDGHDFVADAFRRGASLALIQHDIPGSFRTVRLAHGIVPVPAYHPESRTGREGQSLDLHTDLDVPRLPSPVLRSSPGSRTGRHPSPVLRLPSSGGLCLLVENTLTALQQIAHFWRRKLDLRVIGITGSVGKSTTKEVIAEV